MYHEKRALNIFVTEFKPSGPVNIECPLPVL